MSAAHSLSDELDRDYAPAWRPEPGDKLVGVIAELSEREGYDGDPYPIVTVQADDGSFAFHAFHSVAQNELARLRPQVGDEIGVKYEGVTKSANGRTTYHAYRIRTAGASAGVNWGRYGDGETVAEPDAPVDTADLPAPPADDEPLPF